VVQKEAELQQLWREEAEERRQRDLEEAERRHAQVRWWAATKAREQRRESDRSTVYDECSRNSLSELQRDGFGRLVGSGAGRGEGARFLGSYLATGLKRVKDILLS
jgi:hypothetical protein